MRHQAFNSFRKVNVVNIGVNVAIRLIARNPLKTKGWVHVVHVVHVVEYPCRENGVLRVDRPPSPLRPLHLHHERPERNRLCVSVVSLGFD